VGVGAAIIFSGSHQPLTPDGLEAIQSVDEYQTTLKQADAIWKDRMIKVDRGEKLTADDLQQLKKAEVLYERLGYFEPKTTGIGFAIGRIDVCFGEIGKAEDEFKQTIFNSKLDDNKKQGPAEESLVGETHYFLAECYEEQNVWPSALDESNQAIVINPDRPNYFYVRARAEVQLKQVPEADADLKKALDMDPTNEPAMTLYEMIHDPTRKQG
jgi:tetratricopeptide (TPR) repeat protein